MGADIVCQLLNLYFLALNGKILQYMKFVWALLFALFVSKGFCEINPEKVFVVANSSDEDSKSIASDYAKARSIPARNILLFDMPKSGIVDRQTYVDKIENPLIKKLSETGRVRLMPLNRKDSYGREEYVLLDFDIDYIVLCRGVPWGINPSSNSPKGAPKSDCASVDSELSARFLPAKTLSGFVKNPLFGNYKNPEIFRTYAIMRVARLDGATPKDARSLYESAIYAETFGLRGRAYIDKSQKVKGGDDWLDACKRILEDNGYEVSEDTLPRLYPFDYRMDAPAFYFGWYSFVPSTHFKLEKFRFAPGGFGLHIFSFSARNLRSNNEWCARFANCGVAATYGNVFEPFLGPIHQPHKVLEGLVNGLCAGESAYAAIPVLSWQGVFLGDPFYRPFKVPLDAQIAMIDFGKIDEYSQYAVIRKMNSMLKNNDRDGALTFGRSYIGKIPDNALIWKLCQIAESIGDSTFAEHFALELYGREPWKDDMWVGLSMELANFLSSTGKKANVSKSMGIYSALCGRIKDFDFAQVAVSHARNTAKTYGFNFDSNLTAADETVKRILEERRIAAEKAKAAKAK